MEKRKKREKGKGKDWDEGGRMVSFLAKGNFVQSHHAYYLIPCIGNIVYWCHVLVI
ncbi:hypothetical protein RHMOL_Rhmol06G0141100 [Rhododendron molle]|uniref:Uncharacterized protein n=1 Tax=Rhododendron molle TaxID=49168 RepID=A0ACC0NE62_RHOML|nr:hypothetical protein RHMOL_Rhmol06G0141100 [Rhododendron molle]